MIRSQCLRAARNLSTSNVFSSPLPAQFSSPVDAFVRPFTTAGSGVVSTRRNPDTEFVVERRKYKEEMHGLRKQYSEEIAKLTEGRGEEKKRLLAERMAEIQAEKAERDQIKKQIAAENVIKHQQFVQAKAEERTERRERYKTTLQKVDRLRSKQCQILEEKSSAWVRESELEDRINEALDNPKRLV
mmetsp:Transcript_17448/g.37978  ORF Transcript_17448/g.37978 Transcript_17448/m.37978 type:complete len:187 (-) Transcript_17448:459-1019(-)|eukprot:CAMPEP_0118934092 /NCGR_PEP_ID=MMETSP1169-20130426/13632_1 /TAXON_ID=36882 /ORGANISM="Pyramimonas obovata, Strain CCMP722" /LENGTH=186 /DNA_ID=CAMNT_0006876957 /DNA_START=115 /DNA_END=675 /DNA_ORIENTATION=+